MTYYGNINTDLLGWIPLTAGHVLELGCGEASLAAEYRRRNPAARYVAVEMFEDAAAVARGRVDRLLVGDFEAMDDAELTGGTPFDAIVMGDVLEHLRDPAAVLARLHRLLAADGQLVLSVPNVSHWTAFYHLMHGRWPAEGSGLFDATHLRWFTLASLDAYLRAAGFAQVKARPRQFVLDEALADRWIPKLAELAAAMGVDREAFVQRARTLQYVVVARKAEAAAVRPLHLAVAALAPRLLDVRARLPAEQLQSVPTLAVSYRERTLALPALPVAAPKVLVVQRPAPQDEAAWVAFLAGAIRGGWVVATELDDHPDLIAQVHGRADSPTKWLPIAGVHAVQTSTPALAAAFRAHQPEVATFPNAVFALPERAARADGPARIFYGALNRERVGAAVAAALGPAIAAHADAAFTVVHDRAFFDALPTANKRFVEALPYDAYLAEMGACDIALMPLEGTAPERFKSDVKYLEAASRGVAAIASPAVYADTIRDGETGLIADTPAAFADALRRLLDDPALRGRIAEAARADVRENRMFAGQVAARRDWYAGLWARRDALTQALVARLPALGAALGRG